MKLMTTKYGVARAVRQVRAATLRSSRLAALLRARRHRISPIRSTPRRCSPHRVLISMCSSVDLTYRRSWRRFRSRPGTSARMSPDHNFFDIPLRAGVANLSLAGLARGDRSSSRDVKNGPQYNLHADIVLRRPDLTVLAIDVSNDVIRTRERSM